MPSRLLSSEKIAKGEHRAGEKTKFSPLTMPSRLLSSEKIAKGERRAGEKKLGKQKGAKTKNHKTAGAEPQLMQKSVKK